MPIPIIAEGKAKKGNVPIDKQSPAPISKTPNVKIVPQKRMTTRMNDVIKKKFLAQA